jgi:beta-N-acetylhexosaminidase
MAVQAGIDLVLLGANTPNALQIAAYNAVLAAVKAGQIPEQQINSSVKRILALKESYHLLDWTALSPDHAAARISESHSASILGKTYTTALTIARNEGDLLPIDSEKRVGLIYPSIYPTIQADCQQQAWDIKLETLAVNISPYTYDLGKAVDLAKRVDAVIVFTDNAESDPAQQKLVHLLPSEKTVVVATKSPYDLKYFPDVAGYILAYDPIEPAFAAACKVIFGRQSANGIPPVKLLPLSAAATQ